MLHHHTHQQGGGLVDEPKEDVLSMPTTSKKNKFAPQSTMSEQLLEEPMQNPARNIGVSEKHIQENLREMSKNLDEIQKGKR